MQYKEFVSMLEEGLDTFQTTAGKDAVTGSAAAEAASKKANIEYGESQIRRDDIVTFPTKEMMGTDEHFLCYSYGSAMMCVVTRNGIDIPLPFYASYFSRKLTLVRNGKPTGGSATSSGAPVEDFKSFGGTEKTALIRMCGAKIKVVNVLRQPCLVFAGYEKDEEGNATKVAKREPGFRNVFVLEYITKPESLRAPESKPEKPEKESKGSKGSKGSKKGAAATSAAVTEAADPTV